MDWVPRTVPFQNYGVKRRRLKPLYFSRTLLSNPLEDDCTAHGRVHLLAPPAFYAVSESQQAPRAS